MRKLLVDDDAVDQLRVAELSSRLAVNLPCVGGGEEGSDRKKPDRLQ